jgi:ABC-type Mn2+/Zn2+ transport system permease subunit
MEIILFYLPVILATTVACCILSLYGSILVARERTTNVLFYTEMARLGMFIGLYVNALKDVHSSFLPFFCSLIFTLIFYLISETIGSKIKTNKEAVFLALFILAFQTEDLLLYLLKGVERYDLNSLYGDIVTLEGDHIILLLIFSCVFLILFCFFERKWFAESFNQMILNKTSKNFGSFILFHGSIIIFVTTCVFLMGIWLTLACILVPPIFLSTLPFKNRWAYYTALILVAAGGSFFGFIISLKIEGMPTTPFIVTAIAILTLLFRVLLKRILKI